MGIVKSLLTILVVFTLGAPLYAAGGITFVATDNMNGTCTVTFTATDPCIPPVAMALNITVDGSDPCDAVTGVSGIDSFFDIYMDYAYDDPCTYTYGAGHPVADPCAAGSASLPSMNFCISMGGLGGASEPLAPPPTSSTAFVLEFANAVPDPCDPCTPVVTGTISLNDLRGGVISTDGEPMNTNLPILFSFTLDYCDCCPPGWTQEECFAVGCPSCWCYQYQCKGDTDGQYIGKGDGAVYVNLADLTVFNAAWQKAIGDSDWIANADTYICADFDHESTGKGEGTTRVVLSDLNIFNAGWQVPVSDPYFATNPCFP